MHIKFVSSDPGPGTQEKKFNLFWVLQIILLSLYMEKQFYHSRNTWDIERYKLDVSDDNENTSYDIDGKVIAKWNPVLEIGWILVKK